MTYAVIMAGGTGTRLWPVSRATKPKQLHALVSKNSLLQDTVYDVEEIVNLENVLIVTGKKYEKPIKKQLPGVKHYLFEPYKLGKTLAIGLAALYLYKLDPKAVMVLLWSDSYIAKKEKYQNVLKQAVKYTEDGQNLIIGAEPSSASTAYGYIEMGEKINTNLYQIKNFKEKPDQKTAQKYLKSKKFLWNPGISVWRVDILLDLYKKYEPKIYKSIMQFEDNIHEKTLVEKIDKAYKNVQKTEIEDTIYPKAKNLGVMPADISWNDIGNWGAIYDILATKKDQNIAIGNTFNIDNKGTLLYSQRRLIAAIGLENIAIVDSPDATLICSRSKSQKVKDIVELLKSDKNRKKYL